MKRVAFRDAVPLREPVPGAESLLGALPLAVVALDGAERFRFANRAAEEFFAVSATQLAAMRLFDFVPLDSRLALSIGEARATGVAITLHDLPLESPLLSRRSVDADIAPLTEIEGGVLLGLRAARSAPPEATTRGVAGIAAVLAHEVKNPLSGIRGAAQLLEARLPSADQALAVLIRDEADRIRTLIERVELFGEGKLEVGAVNIHEVLAHVRRLASSGFARHLCLSEAYDPSLPPVAGDRDQLVQVVLNLVKNASEAIGDSGGEIVLASAFEPGVRRVLANGEKRALPLLVTVRDNGPGIPEQLRAHLFEPFVSGKRGGSGLGLALAAKIVAAHGGLIEFDSRPGRTEFRLRLPLFAESEPA